MSKRFLILATVALVALTETSGGLWARGFGGGGFHGGGFHGGDFGGYRGGDFGGDRANFGDSAFRGGADDGYRGYQAPMGRDAGWGADRYASGHDGADRTPTNGELNHFLGLPSDQGFHQMSGRPAASVAGQGSQRPAAAGQWNHPEQQAWANGVRNNLNNWHGYDAGWYGAHPGAWAATGWGLGAAWDTATWAGVGNWFGGWNASPVDYAYGNNIAYEGNQVYIDGQDAESAADYYDQVAGQAEAGAQADASPNGQWLPLGVFALGQPGQAQTNAVIQLAVDKEGILRGNYTDTVADETSQVQGAVDEKTQRVAWTIGDNDSTVMETGLYNLTQPEAPVLIHQGPDRTEQWSLVRLNQNAQPGAAATADPAGPNGPSDN